MESQCIKRPKGAIACGVLMAQALNKCILSILVYSLFYRQDSAIFPYTGILAVFMKNKIKFSKNTAI